MNTLPFHLHLVPPDVCKDNAIVCFEQGIGMPCLRFEPPAGQLRWGFCVFEPPSFAFTEGPAPLTVPGPLAFKRR